MSLIKWNPENNIFPAFTNWMDDFFPENGYKFRTAFHMPAVNVLETKDAFKLKVAAPGFKKEDFKLEIHNGMLVISGEVKEEKVEKDEKYTRQEFSMNTFTRTFSLPENVKTDAIAAEYADGVLKINLPKVLKTEDKPALQISVK